MELTHESEALLPSTIKLTHSRSLSESGLNISESDTDIDSTTNPQITHLTSPLNTKPYYSENDDEWQYEKDHIQNMISSSNSHTKKIRKRKHVQRANSDLSTSLHSSHSKYSKKNKKLCTKLENLNLDDLKNEYLKQRKQRKKDKKQYKKMTRKFHETITATADKYEDELTANQQQLYHEYEAKLIEAEIKRNEDEQKITQLNLEVQQLKLLLVMNNANTTPSTSNKSPHSHQSLHSLDAEIGPPLMNIISPHNHNNNLHNTHGHGYIHNSSNNTPVAAAQMMIHNHAYSFSATIQNNNQSAFIENINKQNNEGIMYNKSNENINEISLLPNAQSMQQKLKMAMSPSLKYNHEYVGSYANIGIGIHGDNNNMNLYNGNEGTDDEDNMIIFDGYNGYKVNDNNSDSDIYLSDTPEVTKVKKKKKKRKQEEESVWDFLIKCITPTVCDNQSV
eukprot:720203_1